MRGTAMKEFPDKILLVKENYYEENLKDYWVLENHTSMPDKEYIRKGVVDDMLKVAEDHAYFAGSEAMREKLVEKVCKWLKEHLDERYIDYYTQSGWREPEIMFWKVCEDLKKDLEKVT